MSELLEDSLRGAASETLEQVAFLWPEVELDEEQQYAPLEAEASVAFHGPFRGELLVRVYGGILPLLASHMLGEDTPPGESEQLDALGEIANIICGDALHRIAPAEEFRLSPPGLSLAGTLHESLPQPTAYVQLGIERGRTDLLLILESADMEARN